MDSNPNSIKALQFDTAIPSVPAEAESAQQGVTCIACRRAIPDRYYDVDGQSVCAQCRGEIAQLAETPRGYGVFARACLFGLVAALLGAILYYAVIAITNFEIGIVAIAIGYMVGYGIRMGTKGRGGRRFQVVALVLTYWAVGLAYTPLVFGGSSEQDAAEEVTTDTTAGAPVDVAVAPVASDSSDSSDASDEPVAVNLPLAFAALLALSLALPVLTVAASMPGGLISAAIIAFGMHQAWRMTAAPQPQISGPYRVGAGPRAVA